MLTPARADDSAHGAAANAPGQAVHRLGVLVWQRDQAEPIAQIGIAGEPQLYQAVMQARAARRAAGPAPAQMQQVQVAGPHRGHANFVVLLLGDAQCELALVRPADECAALLDLVATVPFAFALLNMLLSHPLQAITVADHEGKMLYLSPVHERFLGLAPGTAAGRKAEQVIPNSRLAQVARSGQAEMGQVQHIGPGVSPIVNRLPVHDQGVVVGAVGQVSFSGLDALGRLQQRLQSSRHALPQRTPRHRKTAHAALVGSSAPMQRLSRDIDAVARLDVPVLIQGESGSGKELVVQAVHERGRADPARLVSLNLAALPASLVESELFGYEAGAFTGGKKQGQAGKLEQAEGGTLFLDEVADIPLEIQVKLLRVLENRYVERLGGRGGRQVDFRVVAATHRDLPEMVDKGRFRLDLFYRLSGVVLQVPALRQRLQDIPALVQCFAQSFCERNGLRLPRIAADALDYLASQPWPGNVRQLRQWVEQALVFCEGPWLSAAHFERLANPQAGTPPAQPAPPPLLAPALAGLAPLRQLERNAIHEAIARCGGNKKQAAQALGISRSYLYKALAGDRPTSDA